MEHRSEATSWHAKAASSVWIISLSVLLVGIVSTPLVAEASGRIVKITSNWNPTKTGLPTIITVHGHGRCGMVEVDFGDGTKESKGVSRMNHQNALHFNHIFKSGPSVVVTATSKTCKNSADPLTIEIKGPPIFDPLPRGWSGKLGDSHGAVTVKPGAPTVGPTTKPVGSNLGATSNTGIPETGNGANTSTRSPTIKPHGNVVMPKFNPVPEPK